MQVDTETKRQHIPHSEFSQAPLEAAFLAGRSGVREEIPAPRRVAGRCGMRTAADQRQGHSANLRHHSFRAERHANPTIKDKRANHTHELPTGSQPAHARCRMIVFESLAI